MAIKTRQIVSEPRLLAGQVSAPTTGSGVGAFFALDIGGGATEAAFADESGNIIQITNGGALNLSGISHSTLSGLSNDDHSQYHNDTRGDSRYYTKVSFISTSAGAGDAGKPVKLNGSGLIDATMLPAGSGEANTASNLGTGSGVFAQKSVVDLQFKSLKAGANITLTPSSTEIEIAATGGGSVALFDEYTFALTAANDIASRTPSGLPAGWSVVDGNNGSVDAELSGSADDLVIIHGETKTAIEIIAIKIDSTTPFGGSGRFVVDSSGAAGERVKTNSSQTQSRLKNFQLDVGNNAATIYIRLL